MNLTSFLMKNIAGIFDGFSLEWLMEYKIYIPIISYSLFFKEHFNAFFLINNNVHKKD